MCLSAISRKCICLLALVGFVPAITGCGPEASTPGAKPGAGKAGARRDQDRSDLVPGAEQANPADANGDGEPKESKE